MYTARRTRSDRRLYMEILKWRNYLRSLPGPKNDLERQTLLALSLVRAIHLQQRSIVPVLLMEFASAASRGLAQVE
jgi:hypothetical protein